MENESAEKSKKKRLTIIIIIVVAIVAVLVVWLLFFRQADNAGKLYAKGMEKIDAATDLSMTNVLYIAVENEDGEKASIDVNLDVKLKKPGGKLELSSANRFSNRVGNQYLIGMSGNDTDAWYKDGWLYLYDNAMEYGLAQNYAQEDVFNMYTSGRVLLSKDQIISENIETVGGETIITRHADPEVVAQNKESLLGTLAGFSEGGTEFDELTLTMRLDKSGNPVEYGMKVSFKSTLKDKYEICTIEAVASDISTAPVEIVFPDDLDSYEKIYIDDKDESAPATAPRPERYLELVKSLLPPGATIMEDDNQWFDDELAGTYYIDPGMSQEETVAWYEENLEALGVKKIASDELQDFDEWMSPGGYSVVGEKDGVRFGLIVDTVVMITFDLF